MLIHPARSFAVNPFTVTLLTFMTLIASTGASAQNSASKPAAASPILASYDFEQTTPSGPDTFWLRENGGSVDLSTAFRFGGERSLHLREVAGDNDFSEFLAYFDERRGGTVYIQLYLLVTDLDSTLNIGLAGPGWFINRSQHGHAVWLQTHNGSLRHHPAEGWRELLPLIPFTWYFLDLVYDVERGTYDLAVFTEGSSEPLLNEHGFRNLTNSQPSAVRYLSFIGDLEDQDAFDFFVDDLLIATSPAVRQKPFVAPGRRHFFVDRLAAPPPELRPEELQDLLWRARQHLATREGDALLDDELLEHAADLAFAARELDLAAEIYHRLLPQNRIRMWLKLADIAHLRGDVDGERQLRESIYGRLELAERK